MGTYLESGYMPAIHGKIANSVFSKNRFGNYIRNKTIPVNPSSIPQNRVRISVSDVSKTWAFLSDEQRLKWTEQALNYPVHKKGKHYFLTCFLFFMKINRCLAEVNEPIFLDCPSFASPQYFNSFSVEMINTPLGNDCIFSIEPAIQPETKLRLIATLPVKYSISANTVKLYKIAVLDNNFSSGSCIKDLYINKYAVLPHFYQKAYFAVISTNINNGFC